MPIIILNGTRIGIAAILLIRTTLSPSATELQIASFSDQFYEILTPHNVAVLHLINKAIGSEQ